MPLITGTITNDNKELLEDAHVYVENTTPLNGVLTNNKGKYAIFVNPFQVLTFSFQGQKQKKVISEKNETINIVFQSNLLNEVVVTGSAIKKTETKSSSNIFIVLLLAASITYNIYQHNTKK